MLRVSPRVQDIALDCTLYATGATLGAWPALVDAGVNSRSLHIGSICTAIFLSVVCGGLYRLAITEHLLRDSGADTLQQARLKFLATGTTTTAAATSLALFALKGSFTPWGKLGLGLQAGFSIAVGALYTRLVNRWAVGLMNNDFTKWTPERIRDVVKGADKAVLTSRLPIFFPKNIHFLDQFGQRNDVSPDEIGQIFDEFENYPLWDKGALSEKTLDKLLQAKNSVKWRKRSLLWQTQNDPETQIQILKKSPLDRTSIYTLDRPPTNYCWYPALHSETAERLLQNPSIWDLVIIHQDELENKLDNIDNDQLLELAVDEMFYPWKKFPIQLVINWLPAKKLETFLKTLPQKNLHWFRCAFNHILRGKTHQSENDLVPLIRNITATAQVEYFLASYKKPKPLYGITFADACSLRKDVDNQTLANFFMHYEKLRSQKVEQWYKGCLSEHTLSRMIDYLKTNNKPELLQLMMHLTCLEPEKQLKIIKELPLGPRYICNTPTCFTYPTLATETIDSILATNKPLAWDLALCRASWHLNKWDDVEFEDLLNMDKDFPTNGVNWNSSPATIVIESLPSEMLKQFLRFKTNLWFLGTFMHVLYGKTRLKPTETTQFVRDNVQGSGANLVQAILEYSHKNEYYYKDAQKYVLAVVDGVGLQKDSTIAELREVFERLVINNEKEFWYCPSWNVEQLSKTTIDSLFVILAADDCTDQFRRCLLHLMSSYPERQIQILDALPLGPRYIFHTVHPAKDRSRFHYPRLAEGTIDDLMKKSPPTVWDLAFCARQRKSVGEKLAKVPPQELLLLAGVRGNDTGCASVHTSCWNNELCWNNSLIKVAFEALPAESRDAFLRNNRPELTVWSRFALRYALKEGTELKDEELLSWAFANDPHLTQEIFTARQNLFSYQQQILSPEQEKLLSNLQTMYKIATLRINDFFPIEAAIQFIQSELNKGGGNDLIPIRNTTAFSPLPNDVFNMTCKYLYPTERIRLAGACTALRYRIYSDKGQAIWTNEGSIRAALRMLELSKLIEEAGNFTPDQLFLNKILARAWPRNFWPDSKKPRWINDL